MSILINKDTRLIVQGITGREGTFHTQQMLEYGANVVAGVTPGKGGQEVLGVPVFNTVKEAVEATGANASVVFVPAMHTKASALEAIDAGVPLVMTIAEHVPVQDMPRPPAAASSDPTPSASSLPARARQASWLTASSRKVLWV